jgi:carboxymethylenebutenolidase
MRHDPIDETSGAASRRHEGYLALPGSGSGPGLVLLHDPAAEDGAASAIADLFAEEGYAVLMPEPGLLSAPGGDAALGSVATAIEALRSRRECTGKVGVLGFGRGADLALRAALSGKADCAVAYDPTGSGALPDGSVGRSNPAVVHSPEHGDPAAAKQTLAALGVEFYAYPGARAGFATPGSAAFDKSASLMAHTRTLGLLRRVMGPRYDLEALWEQHTALEFAFRDAEATMTTMVADPYVNHIPTMTGGVGYTELLRFYKHHFIPTTPADARLVPVSRTVGVDRLVDEFVFTLTHDCEVDWLLPGVPPTHRRLEIPMLAVVRFRGNKLYNEHIYWDQATVLVQAGLLDPGLLPVAGVETARKLLDESLPSNTLMRRWSESVPKAAE